MYRLLDKIKKDSRKIIFICSSQYHVLVALSMAYLSGTLNKSFFIMFSPDAGVVDSFHEIEQRMIQNGIKCKTIKKNMLMRAVGISDVLNSITYSDIMKTMDITDNKFTLINFSWNQKIVRYPASIYFDKCYESFFIEEGATQYLTPDEKWIINVLKSIYGNRIRFWNDNKLKAIYVQNKQGYPEELCQKIKEFSLAELFNSLNEDEVENIVSIMAGGNFKRDIEYIGSETLGIIFTQPLSEDGFISEKKKIETYKNLVDFYSEYGPVVVKVHPRDKTVYDFKNVRIIYGNYPSELFMLCGIKFSFAIGICTSSIETVDADKKINLNEKYLSELRYELKEIV